MMMLKKALKNYLLPYLPASIKRLRARTRAPAMTEAIEALAIKGGSNVELGGEAYAHLELENGTQMIGAKANVRQLGMFGWLAEKKGLPREHAKILIDAAARYVYPHMAVGYLKMDSPLSGRSFFHPQHQNLAAEDETLDAGTRETLAKVFKPRKGWKVIDVGAYLGHGALKMAQTIGPEGKLLCVEAKPQNVAVIREHIRRNRLDQVEVLENAIWSEAGNSIDFHVTERQANAIDAEVVDGDTVTVTTTSLPVLIERLGSAPNLVSLTVNGAEVEAIDGLKGMAADRLPERILAPGWYTKDGEPRWKFIKPALEALGYQVAVTSGGMVFGWRVE